MRWLCRLDLTATQNWAVKTSGKCFTYLNGCLMNMHPPFSSAKEVKAAEVLAECLASGGAIRQGDRLVLVVADHQHLSHRHFALPLLRGAINTGGVV